MADISHSYWAAGYRSTGGPDGLTPEHNEVIQTISEPKDSMKKFSLAGAFLSQIGILDFPLQCNI